MKQKLLTYWTAVQPYLAKAYGWSPLATGIVIGYFGKPILKMAVDAGASLIKMVIG